MTYGWMLLVVAIVGGAIFATVQGQCTQSTSGFTGGNVLVDNFGVTGDENLALEIRNGGSNTLILEEVAVGGSLDELIEDINTNPENLQDVPIGVGSSEVIVIDDDFWTFTESSDCNSNGLKLTYSIGNIDDQVSEGILTDGINFDGDF